MEQEISVFTQALRNVNQKMQTQANMKTNLWECYYGSISSLSISPKITHLCFNVLSTEIPRSYCRTWNCRENSVNSDQTHRTTAKQRCVHTPELSHQAQRVSCTLPKASAERAEKMLLLLGLEQEHSAAFSPLQLWDQVKRFAEYVNPLPFQMLNDIHVLALSLM